MDQVDQIWQFNFLHFFVSIDLPMHEPNFEFRHDLALTLTPSLCSQVALQLFHLPQPSQTAVFGTIANYELYFMSTFVNILLEYGIFFKVGFTLLIESGAISSVQLISIVITFRSLMKSPIDFISNGVRLENRYHIHCI